MLTSRVAAGKTILCAGVGPFAETVFLYTGRFVLQAPKVRGLSELTQSDAWRASDYLIVRSDAEIARELEAASPATADRATLDTRSGLSLYRLHRSEQKGPGR